LHCCISESKIQLFKHDWQVTLPDDSSTVQVGQLVGHFEQFLKEALQKVPAGHLTH